MKRAFVISLGVLMLCASGAFAADPLKATIPFPFYAGNQQLPAGEYVFRGGLTRGLDSNLVVQKRDGSDSYFVAAIPDGGKLQSPDYRVTFKKYGDTYFLSRITNGMSEIKVLKSRSEKKMASLQGKKAPVVASLRLEK
jgi:hypothetical protein